jgi:hypothetical protein
MRWEDQELNYAVPETKFPEVLAAKFALLSQAEGRLGVYLPFDQSVLATLQLKQFADRGVPRIDRVCLHFRLACGLSPGGGAYPSLGIFHYWSGSKSMYAIVHISPRNDSLQIMSLSAKQPNQISDPLSGLTPGPGSS